MLASEWLLQTAEPAGMPTPGVINNTTEIEVDDGLRPSNSQFENSTSKGEATWSDSQPRRRSRGQRFRQMTDMLRPQAALSSRLRRAPLSSPIATGRRSGSDRKSVV